MIVQYLPDFSRECTSPCTNDTVENDGAGNSNGGGGGGGSGGGGTTRRYGRR